MTEEAINKLIALGGALVGPQGNPLAPFSIVPADCQIQSLETHLPNPARIREKATLHDPESFIRYVSTFALPGTAIWWDEPKMAYTAILDYHEETQNEVQRPHWCSHRATYRPYQTAEWKDWLTMNKQRVSQLDFGQFLENHIDSVSSERDVLSMALALQYKREESFSSYAQLDNGKAVLKYEETVKGTAMETEVPIPNSFNIHVQPYLGGPAIDVRCRFRFHVVNRAVQFWFEMLQLPQLLIEVHTAIRQRIEIGTNTIILAGEATQ